MALNAPLFVSGFEHRLLVGAANPNAGIFDNVTGTPTIDTSVVAPGGGSASMKVDSTAAAHNIGTGHPGVFPTGTYFSCIFKLRISSAATLAGGPAVILLNHLNANGNVRVDVNNDGSLRAFGVTGAVAQSTAPLALDKWYTIITEANTASNPATMKVYVVELGSEASVSPSQVSASMTTIALGNISSGGSVRSIINIDDWMVYNTSGDYALLKQLGPYTILGLNPSAVGTHSSPGNFQDESSVALTGGDTTSFNKLDDFPGASDTSTYVKQVTTTGYLEYLMAAPPVGVSVVAARAIMSVFSSTTTGNNISFRGYDGTTEGADIQSSSIGSTTIVYHGGMVAKPSGGSWSITDWLGQTARLRIGYSSDIAPVPQMSAIMVELAVGLPAPMNQRNYGPNNESRRTSWFQ